MTFAVPTTISEYDVVSYLRADLGGMVDTFGWTTADGASDIAVEAMSVSDVSSLASVSGADAVRRFRVILRAVAWRRVCSLTAGDFDFSADGGRYDRSQIHGHAMEQARAAEADALAMGVDVSGLYTVCMHKVVDLDTVSDTSAEWAF